MPAISFKKLWQITKNNFYWLGFTWSSIKMPLAFIILLLTTETRAQGLTLYVVTSDNAALLSSPPKTPVLQLPWRLADIIDLTEIYASSFGDRSRTFDLPLGLILAKTVNNNTLLSIWKTTDPDSANSLQMNSHNYQTIALEKNEPYSFSFVNTACGSSIPMYGCLWLTIHNDDTSKTQGDDAKILPAVHRLFESFLPRKATSPQIERDATGFIITQVLSNFELTGHIGLESKPSGEIRLTRNPDLLTINALPSTTSCCRLFPCLARPRVDSEQHTPQDFTAKFPDKLTQATAALSLKTKSCLRKASLSEIDWREQLRDGHFPKRWTVKLAGLEKSGVKYERWHEGQVLGYGSDYTVTLLKEEPFDSSGVAIKRPKNPTKKMDQIFLQREALALHHLSHSNIVKAYGFHHHPAGLVMKHLEGQTLNHLAGTFPTVEGVNYACRRIGYQMFDALNYLHKKHIGHRDCKPENTIVDNRSPDFHTTLLDLNYCVHQPEGTLSKTKSGSPAYTSPEILHCRNTTYDAFASDLWSAGATLRTAYTGVPPYPASPVDANDRQATLYNLIEHRRIESNELYNRRHEIHGDNEISSIISKACQRSPADRLSAEIFRDWLRSSISTTPRKMIQ